MKRFTSWILFVLLLALGGLAGSADAADQHVKAPATLNSSWLPSLNAARDACIFSGGGEIYDDPPQWKGEERRIDGPLTGGPYAWTLAGDPTATVSIRLRGYYSYYGSGSFVRTLGLKWGVLSYRLRLRTDGSSLITVDGDTAHQSTNLLTLRMQGWTGCKNCVGAYIGSAGSNDVSGIVLDTFNFESEVYNNGSTQQERLTNVHNAGNVGVVIAGPNTCGITVQNSWITGCDKMITTAGVSPGGSGLVIRNLSGSYNVLGLQNQAAFPASWDGGRLELGSKLLQQGSSAGQAGVSVSIRNVMCDSFDTTLPWYGDRNSLIYWGASGSLDLFGVNGYGNNWLPAVFVAVHNNGGAGAAVAMTGCFNKQGAAQVVVPVTASAIVPVEGSLSIQK